MNSFFGITFQSNSTWGLTLSLLLAVLLGGLIGLERELHGHPAGLRTHILVCVGSTLITIVSVYSAHLNGANVDPTRISAQIVTGIGFLGAGAIIREGGSIRGLTTAASLWATAAIGLAVGTSPYLGGLAVIATAIVLFTLWSLNKVEDWIEFSIHRICLLIVTVNATEGSAAAVLSRISSQNLEVRSIDYEPGPNKDVRQMIMRVKVPINFDRNAFLAEMGNEPAVVSVNLR